MSEVETNGSFDGIEEIISDTMRFKAKLAIGEDAYASIRLKNAVFEFWDAAGAAGTAVAVAKSGTIASTFFAPTGMLAFMGIGTAVTPIGWVVVAGVVVGGSWVGVTRYLKQATGSRVTTIPDFINTPIDVLGLGLFDLMAPLALKVAAIDGRIDAEERTAICSYFVSEWGFDANFVKIGIPFTESRLDDFSVKDSAHALAEFSKQNRDCNYREMSRELVAFLRDVSEADGKIDEREEMAIEKIQDILLEEGRIRFSKIMKAGARTVTTASTRCAAGATRLIKRFSRSGS